MNKMFLSILFTFVLLCSLFVGCKEEEIKTYTVTVYYQYDTHQHTLVQKYDPYHQETYTIDDGKFQKAREFCKMYEFEIEAESVIGSLEVADYKENTYRFCGWYTDKYYTDQWSLPRDKVYSNLTLFAKFEKIK